jgi:nucleoid-associated protein YgaU
MVMTPLKALLFLLGGTVAVGTVGYVAGVFDGMLPQRPAMVAALPDSPDKPAETPAAAAPAQPGASVPAPAAPVAAPAAGDTPAPAPQAREPVPVPPSFDIVRVEPDGSVVIAGKASSNGEVEVLAGVEILARTVAGVDGDFAVVLDDPLKPGDYQVVLRDTSPANDVVTSVETAIISVPDAGSGQVLALVEEPGKPSRLITVPAAPEPKAAPAEVAPAAETESPADDATVAEAKTEPVTDDAPQGAKVAAEADATPGAVAETAPDPAPETPAPQAPVAAGDTAPVTGAEPEAAPGTVAEAEATPEAVADAGAAPEPIADAGAAPEPIAEAGAAPETITDANAAPETTAEGAPASGQEASGQDMDASGTQEVRTDVDEPAAPAAEDAGGEVVIARTDPAAPIVETPETVAPQAPAEARRPTVLVEAVEIEGRTVFVAGRAEPGMTVRVYANDIFLGETTGSQAGRFLIEVQRDLPVGDYIIRADLLDRGGRTVVARAAVPFQREEGESIAAVAPPASPSAPPASPSAPVAETAPPAAAAQPPAQAPEPAKAEAGQAPAADAPASPQDAAQASGTAPAQPPAQADAPATAQPPATGQAPAAPEPTPATAEIAEVTAPKLQSVQGGVIIRRGDSLWRISRRVYGRGVRYSTIYVANQDQIADPHRIWPGQIFRLPEATEEGERADLDAIGDQKTVIEPADGETSVQ